MIDYSNPLNIRHSQKQRWLGQTGQKKGFCVFASREYGIRAAAYLLTRSYRKAHAVTIRQIINRFAPPSENNTARYVQFVAQSFGDNPDYEPKGRQDFALLIQRMAIQETGQRIPLDEIVAVMRKYALM